MKTEYEVRVLEIDVEKLIHRLEKLGAKKVGDWNQRRYVYDIDSNSKSRWIRLRTNGQNTTLTYKEIREQTVDGTQEIEFEVENFDTVNEFLQKVGFLNGRYQENHRIRYMLNDVELDIDTWPMIPTYLEIEAQNEQQIYDMIKLLELENEKITAEDVVEVYKNYGHEINDIKILKF